MSYIYAHKVKTMRENGDREQTRVAVLHEGNEVFCRRDGEELSAAASIIDLIDELDNGEALVITRDLF
ncbi:hypothetical protein [Streptomyces ardesiacus]